MPTYLLLIALVLSSAVSTAFGAPAPTKGVIWDYWYTVSIKKTPYQYYNDKIEVVQGRVRFQNNLWKKEEGFINEEHIGTFSANDKDLSPLFYNFQSTYKSSARKIDGTVKDGKLLVVTGSEQGNPFPAVRVSIPKQTIFSTIFPYWLGQRLANEPEGKSVSFIAIPEDRKDTGFAPSKGTVKIEKPDDFSKRTKTVKLTVNYQGQNGTWYVEKSGAPVRIELSPSIVVERTTKEKAIHFLDDADVGE